MSLPVSFRIVLHLPVFDPQTCAENHGSLRSYLVVLFSWCARPEQSRSLTRRLVNEKNADTAHRTLAKPSAEDVIRRGSWQWGPRARGDGGGGGRASGRAGVRRHWRRVIKACRSAVVVHKHSRVDLQKGGESCAEENGSSLHDAVELRA